MTTPADPNARDEPGPEEREPWPAPTEPTADVRPNSDPVVAAYDQAIVVAGLEQAFAAYAARLRSRRLQARRTAARARRLGPTLGR